MTQSGAPKRTWNVPGEVVRVIDGDTIEVRLDLGWRVSMKAYVRLQGIDCPELRTEAGQQARAYVDDLLPVGCIVHVTSTKLDKYGRVLGIVHIGGPDGPCLASLLLDAGHAEPYL